MQILAQAGKVLSEQFQHEATSKKMHSFSQGKAALCLCLGAGTQEASLLMVMSMFTLQDHKEVFFKQIEQQQQWCCQVLDEHLDSSMICLGKQLVGYLKAQSKVKEDSMQISQICQKDFVQYSYLSIQPLNTANFGMHEVFFICALDHNVCSGKYLKIISFLHSFSG